MPYYHVISHRVYVFPNLRTPLVRATPRRSGDKVMRQEERRKDLVGL